MESLFGGRNLSTDHWSGRLLFQRHVHNQQSQVWFFLCPLSLSSTHQQDGARQPRVQDQSDDIEFATMPTPPVLAYARHHGLCIDHEAEDVLRLLDVLTPIPEDDDLADPKHTALDLQQFKVDLEEPKIQLTREEGILLAKNIRPPSDFQVNWSDFLPDPRRKQKMKLEVPILTTDHDQDMEEFRSEMKSRQE